MTARKKSAKTKPEIVMGWHFMPASMVPRNAPEGFKPIKQGATIRHRGKVALCASGLHFCRDFMVAFQGFNYGPVISYVECSGKMLHDLNKSVCSVRKHVFVRDMTRELHEFACWCAERALTVAKVTDKRSWKAIETKRAWLDGEATDAELAAARAAAMAAAWDAAMDAARAAAMAAARAAARAAAMAAARAAAMAAAWDAEREQQRKWWMETLRSFGCPIKEDPANG